MATIYYAGFFGGQYGYSEAANGYRSVLEKTHPAVKYIDLNELEGYQMLRSHDFSDSILILHKRPTPTDLKQETIINIYYA